MFVPPAGKEHPPLIPEIVLVPDYPHETVMDDVCHRRPSLVSHYKYGKNGNVTVEKIFFEKKFRACNILLFSILMRKRRINLNVRCAICVAGYQEVRSPANNTFLQVP